MTGDPHSSCRDPVAGPIRDPDIMVYIFRLNYIDA